MSRIDVRIPKDRFPRIKERLRDAAKVAGVSESVLVLAAIEGICSAIEKYGAITLPLPDNIVGDSVGRLERISAMAKHIHEAKKAKK